MDQVSTAADEFYKLSSAQQSEGNQSAVAGGELTQANSALSMKIINLLHAVRGPAEMVFAQVENITTEFAAETGADKELIVRLMRSATQGYGSFAEVGVETYAHTPFPEIYLVPQTHNPLTRAHKLPEGGTMWSHADQDPQRCRDVNGMMEAGAQATPVLGIYPFETELGPYVEDDETVVLVDVGGGKCHATRQIREGSPGLKSRMILQDRPLIDEKDLPGIEKMAHDFFPPQPVKGALAYCIRRCLHDWDDENVVRILQRLADAMKDARDRSRLLIVEMVLPPQGADVTAGCYDMIMMCIGGTERTEKQWVSLLDRAGLKLKKTWSAKGGPNAVVEAWLK
ncbi:MAG: hypothetical protein M1816_001512 [Peltula sp. TS41687]|nr:MAG: hypothetical protein M1816_001512 [Peltula sp. TS41687]